LLFSAVISQHFSKNRMIISSGCKNMVSQKMYGFYWATLYILGTGSIWQYFEMAGRSGKSACRDFSGITPVVKFVINQDFMSGIHVSFWSFLFPWFSPNLV